WGESAGPKTWRRWRCIWRPMSPRGSREQLCRWMEDCRRIRRDGDEQGKNGDCAGKQREAAGLGEDGGSTDARNRSYRAFGDRREECRRWTRSVLHGCEAEAQADSRRGAWRDSGGARRYDGCYSGVHDSAEVNRNRHGRAEDQLPRARAERKDQGGGASATD